MPLTKLLDLCFKHGMLYKGSVESNLQMVKLGSTGSMLKEILEKEWFQNMVINRDCPIFISTSFHDTFTFAKNICNNYIPFGIAETLTSNAENNLDANNEIINQLQFNQNDLTLRCTTFVSPIDAISYFHQWQRQRKIWWRKISASPGRYSLTDIQTVNSNQEVKIVARYLWGKLTLETMTLHGEDHPQLPQEELEVKFGRRKGRAQYIKSDISQLTMLLNAMCDAFEEPNYHGKSVNLFRFHRKIAPYKISFAITQPKHKETGDELTQLAAYLCKKLRANNISSLLLPTASKIKLEQQFQQFDELGVPYTILLNEQTLKNGLAHLRSRDTTLKEQVHVGNIPTYVEQLFKNF